MEPVRQPLRESEKSSRYVVDAIARLLASGRSCSPVWKTGVNEAKENPSERNLQGLIARPKASRTLAILLVLSLALFLIGRTEAQADVTSGRSDEFRNVLQAHRNPAKINMPIVDGKDIKFVRVSTADRVWETKVSEIVQDDRGFMWFATLYGLYRYDGYNFKVFVHDPNSPGSLGGVEVTALFKDRSGALWIGCDRFLNKLNPETETFTRYAVPYVTHISQDKAGMLWLATYGGLYGLDPAKGLIAHYSHDPHNPSTLSSEHVIYSGEDSTGRFWVATPGCLDQFDRRTGTVTQHIPIPEAPYGFGFYEDRFGVFWIFHVSPNPLSVLDRKTNTLTQYVFPRREPPGTAVTRVTAMLEDHKGTLWIATHGPGLLKFDREHGRFIRYRNDPSDPDSIPQNDVDALFADHEGSMWTGLGSMGPVRFATKPLPFTSFVYDPGGRNARNPFVGAIYQDRQGVLWVGTPKALNRIDRTAGSFIAYRNGGPETDTDVIAIREDNSGFLWVGTYGHGLLRFDRRTGHFKTYTHNPSDPSSLSDDFVSRLLFDHNGTLWAGTQEGLSRFDPGTESFTSYKFTSRVRTLLGCLELVEDREGLLWVGTSEGLLHFDPATEKVAIYQHDMNRPGTLSDNRVNSVHFDRMGELWVGTQNGLNKFDLKTMTFSVYTERNGLPGNAVGCILEDDRGYLWVSTNNGVARFNPQTAAFNNYSTADGLPGPNLTGWGACSKSSSGEMFFGGFSGATAFVPDKVVVDASYVPPIVLTDFRLAGNAVEIGRHSPLQESISFTKDLILSHSQNIFSLTFAALSYVNPATNRYRYKLEGLERDWNEVSSDRRQATYTTLPTGTYTFRVQGATNRGAWSEPGVALLLQILPAWWNTRWFRAVSVATCVALMWALYQLRLRQLAKQFNSRLEERISERTRIARDLHDSLLQGFQGLIFRFQAARELLPGRPNEATEALDIALKRADKVIVEGRDTVSDLRQSVMDDSDIGQALTALGEELAAQSDNGSVPCVRVLVEGKQRELDPMLRDEIYRIGREALRNAFRHAQAQKIEAQITYGDSEFVFHVRDDGIGIPPEVAGQGGRLGHWGLPGMRERAKNFGGKLDVWSEQGAGTEIELIVPAAIAYGGSNARSRFWFLRKKVGVTDGKQS